MHAMVTSWQTPRNCRPCDGIAFEVVTWPVSIHSGFEKSVSPLPLALNTPDAVRVEIMAIAVAAPGACKWYASGFGSWMHGINKGCIYHPSPTTHFDNRKNCDVLHMRALPGYSSCQVGTIGVLAKHSFMDCAVHALLQSGCAHRPYGPYLLRLTSIYRQWLTSLKYRGWCLSVISSNASAPVWLSFNTQPFDYIR